MPILALLPISFNYEKPRIGHCPKVLRENEKMFVKKGILSPVSSYKPVNVREGRFGQLHFSIDELNVITTTTRTS